MAPGAPTTRRRVAAVVATAAASAFGALILGEYDLHGLTPYIAGVLFGLAMAEVALTVGRLNAMWLAVVTGGLSLAGLVWAAWISSGEGVSPIAAGAWVGAALGGVVAFGWVRWSARRGGSNRPPP